MSISFVAPVRPIDALFVPAVNDRFAAVIRVASFVSSRIEPVMPNKPVGFVVTGLNAPPSPVIGLRFCKPLREGIRFAGLELGV